MVVLYVLVTWYERFFEETIDVIRTPAALTFGDWGEMMPSRIFDRGNVEIILQLCLHSCRG